MRKSPSEEKENKDKVKCIFNAGENCLPCLHIYFHKNQRVRIYNCILYDSIKRNEEFYKEYYIF